MVANQDIVSVEITFCSTVKSTDGTSLAAPAQYCTYESLIYVKAISAEGTINRKAKYEGLQRAL